MLEKEIQILKDMAEPAIQTAVESYASWHFVSAIGWLVFGVIGLIFSYKAIGWWAKIEDKDDAGPVFAIAGITILSVISVLVIFSHIPDLFNPKAAAIHQILMDVRGK